MGVMHMDFMSDQLGYQTNVYVILPDSVREGKKPNGILYLLHGGSGNGLDWMRYTSIERHNWPYDLAIIMPDTDGSAFYADQKHGYPYFTYLTEELPCMIEALLPILSGVEKRYVAGISMGGYGAYKWAFQKPEYFTAAANLSGLSFIMDIMTQDSHPLAGRQSMIACNWETLEQLYGSESDSKYWIDRAAENGTKLPRLFAAIGTEDPTYPMAEKYVKYCEMRGVPLHFEESPGSHDWAFWDVMIGRFLEWAICE